MPGNSHCWNNKPGGGGTLEIMLLLKRGNLPVPTVHSSHNTRQYNTNTVTKHGQMSLIAQMTGRLNKYIHSPRPLKCVWSNNCVDYRARTGGARTPGSSGRPLHRMTVSFLPGTGKNRTRPTSNKGAITQTHNSLSALYNRQEECADMGNVPWDTSEAKKEKGRGAEPVLLKIPQNQRFPFSFPSSSFPGLLFCHFYNLTDSRQEQLRV